MIRLSELLKARLLLFDVDDTLIYTYKNGFNKVNAAAIQAGRKTITFDEYSELYGVYTFEECLRKWFKMADVAYIKHLYSLQKRRMPYEPICNFGELQVALHIKRSLMLRRWIGR